MNKKALSIVLTTVMAAGMLAACGSSSSGSSASGAATAAADAAAESTAQTQSADDGDIVKLVVWGYGTADTEDCNEVAEAVSKITREKIGAEVELVRGKDSDQLNLALTTGEPIDLLNYNNIPGQLTAVVRNNYALELDDLVNQYGQDALKVIDPVDLEACRYSGKLYALPDQKDTSRSAGFSMRKDIVDELGIEVPEYGTYEDMHDILVKVHEAYPDMYPLVPTWAGGGMQDNWAMDPLGDYYGVIENVFDTSTTLVNWYDSETYKNFCKMMYQWNQEGLIMPDATTTTENNLLSGNGFAMYENWKPGKELENYKANGKEVVFMKVIQPIKYTTIPNGNSFIIPYSSQHPEKAMELWNLMYSDPEVSNLFINGIEGKHWEYTDDSKQFITTPEGVDPNASGYSSADWAWPNQQITPIWQGGDPDLWAKLKEFNQSGHPSPAMGFNWDSTSVTNQVTACSNVVSSYDVALRWGTMDPDENIPKFVSELEAAGINDIISAKQAALDEYLASEGSN